MYRVREFFTDLQDNNHAYHAGDQYPREGVSASEARIEELSGTKNKRGVRLIELVPDDDAVKDAGEPEKKRGRPKRG